MDIYCGKPTNLRLYVFCCVIVDSPLTLDCTHFVAFSGCTHVKFCINISIVCSLDYIFKTNVLSHWWRNC